MGKTTGEQKCVYLVKHGKRLLLLGIPPKLIFHLHFGSRMVRQEKHELSNKCFLEYDFLGTTMSRRGVLAEWKHQGLMVEAT